MRKTYCKIILVTLIIFVITYPTYANEDIPQHEYSAANVTSEGAINFLPPYTESTVESQDLTKDQITLLDLAYLCFMFNNQVDSKLDISILIESNIIDEDVLELIMNILLSQ